MPIRSSFLVLSMGLLSTAFAQAPAQRRPPQGQLQGRVLDGSTKGPVEFATVTVMHASKDSILGGAMVQGNGDFRVERLPVGPMRVRVAFMGYRTLERATALSPTAPELDLGDLLLEPDQVLLKEAEVVRERATTMMQVDRRVFNVEKDLSAQGGSAVDVMRNVPGLSVDVDGNVEMRGGNPMVLVDGRPTTMTLEDIPAGEIERVEVITNPSVVFDAGTSGGIINVVLKKNTRPGYFGTVQAGAGTNDRYQGGLNLSMRDGRWGLNLSYNYNTGRNLTDARTDRTERLGELITGTFSQRTDASSKRAGHGGRLAVDYRVNNRNTLTFSQSARGRSMSGDDRQTFSGTTAGAPGTYGRQRNTEDQDHLSLTSALGLRHTAPEPGKEWVAEVIYNRWDRTSRSGFDTWSFAGDAELSTSPRLQANTGGSDFEQLTAQFDVTDPLNARNKLEWGFKSDQSWDRTWLDVMLHTPQSGGPVRDSALSNDYDIRNMINAAYVNWAHQLDSSWSLQAGLRFEQSWYDVTIKGMPGSFGYRYPDGSEDLARSIFPALYLARKWDGGRELQVNFSRKISRPRFWQITPFFMASDSRNARIGNPTLAPEMGNLAEVNHLLPFMDGKASWFTSVFGRYTENVITSYAAPMAGDSTILLSTFVNGTNSLAGGWENVLKFEPSKGPHFTLSGTVQYVDIGLQQGDGSLRNQGINWEAGLLVNYRVRKDLVVQVNGDYDGPRIMPQGRSMSQYGVDISASYDITKQLAAVAAVNDVFFTRRWGNILDTPLLYQESYRRRDMRNFRITLTWKFGQQDASLFRRKQQQRRDGGGDGMEEGF